MMSLAGYSLRTQLLTPLHIGSGEDADAFDSALLGDEFLRIDDTVVLEGCSDAERQDLVHLSSRPPAYAPRLGEIATGLPEAIKYRIAATTQAQEQYAKRLTQGNATDLSCRTFIKTGDRPYLPGSSIKGAIRTAVLNEMVAKPLKDLNDRKIQSETLGYAETDPRTGNSRIRFDLDPFSAIRFADSAPLPTSSLQLDVVEVVTKKRAGWLPALPMLVETLNPRSTESISLTVSIVEKKALSKPIGMNDIIRAAKNFGTALIEREIELCSGYAPLRDFYQNLDKISNSLGAEEFLLRLGWGSGFDAVSTNLARSPKETKYSRRVMRGSGTPLSWVKVTVEE